MKGCRFSGAPSLAGGSTTSAMRPRGNGVVFEGDVEGFAFNAWHPGDGIRLAALTGACDRTTALLSHARKSRLPLSEARQLVA